MVYMPLLRETVIRLDYLTDTLHLSQSVRPGRFDASLQAHPRPEISIRSLYSKGADLAFDNLGIRSR
jgi:hypothetical protein